MITETSFATAPTRQELSPLGFPLRRECRSNRSCSVNEPERWTVRRRTPVGVNDLLGALVDQLHGGLFVSRLRLPLHAPCPKYEQDLIERSALFRRMVFVSRRTPVIQPLLDHAFLLEPPEPGGQQKRRYSCQRLDIVETAHTKADLAHDQQRPLIADHAQRARDRAYASAIFINTHFWQSLRSTAFERCARLSACPTRARLYDASLFEATWVHIWYCRCSSTSLTGPLAQELNDHAATLRRIAGTTAR
jgi:hypothetical protein